MNDELDVSGCEEVEPRNWKQAFGDLCHVRHRIGLLSTHERSLREELARLVGFNGLTDVDVPVRFLTSGTHGRMRISRVAVVPLKLFSNAPVVVRLYGTRIKADGSVGRAKVAYDIPMSEYQTVLGEIC